jgi:hypothetical protein
MAKKKHTPPTSSAKRMRDTTPTGTAPKKRVVDAMGAAMGRKTAPAPTSLEQHFAQQKERHRSALVRARFGAASPKQVVPVATPLGTEEIEIDPLRQDDQKAGEDSDVVKSFT